VRLILSLRCFSKGSGDISDLDAGANRCFLAATPNDIYRLPPEFLRKGRFDEIFFVDLPDQKIRMFLFSIHLRKRGLNPEKFDCKSLAEKAADFSGAEIEQAIISALYRASSKKEPVSTDHILEQISLTKPLALLKQEEIASLGNGPKNGRSPPKLSTSKTSKKSVYYSHKLTI